MAMEIALVVLTFILLMVVFLVFYVMWKKKHEVPGDEVEIEEEKEVFDKEFHCPTCDAEVDAYASTCHNCGSEFQLGEFECPKCGKTAHPQDIQCKKCKFVFERQVARCPRCNQVITPDTTKCPKCHETFWSPIEPEVKEAPKEEKKVPELDTET